MACSEKRREREIGISFIEIIRISPRGRVFSFLSNIRERVKRFNFDVFPETCENRNNLKVR